MPLFCVLPAVYMLTFSNWEHRKQVNFQSTPILIPSHVLSLPIWPSLAILILLHVGTSVPGNLSAVSCQKIPHVESFNHLQVFSALNLNCWKVRNYFRGLSEIWIMLSPLHLSLWLLYKAPTTSNISTTGVEIVPITVRSTTLNFCK